MKKNILIVEDNKKCREMLVGMLSEIDAELTVLEADNIGDAYRYALEVSIHLFILDIILDTSVKGDMSGIKFASEMRNLDKYRTTPIIFITSLEDPKLFSYSELHCYRYIEKPFKTDEAIRTLREALGVVVEEKKSKYIFFRKEGLMFPVKVEDIVYIVFEKPMLIVFLQDDFLDVPYISLRKMLLKLDSLDFEQCNRYTLVNKNYVEYLDPVNNFLKIKNRETVLQIGNIYKKNFLSGQEDD